MRSERPSPSSDCARTSSCRTPGAAEPGGELRPPAQQACRRGFLRFAPAIIVVQGDTLTAHAAAAAGREIGIRVAHVEAGLRTQSASDPFPEEWFRRRIARLADLHFAPTALAVDNLLNEGVEPSSVYWTGNTGIDSLKAALGELDAAPRATDGNGHGAARHRVLVTLHRRENHDRNADVVCRALLRLADLRPHLRVTFPVHPNPRVAVPIRRRLGGHPAFELVAPMAYRDFIAAAASAALLVSDSGGIQEEAPHFGTPLLVPRGNTERPKRSPPASSASFRWTSRRSSRPPAPRSTRRGDRRCRSMGTRRSARATPASRSRASSRRRLRNGRTRERPYARRAVGRRVSEPLLSAMVGERTAPPATRLRLRRGWTAGCWTAPSGAATAASPDGSTRTGTPHTSTPRSPGITCSGSLPSHVTATGDEVALAPRAAAAQRWLVRVGTGEGPPHTRVFAGGKHSTIGATAPSSASTSRWCFVVLRRRPKYGARRSAIARTSLAVTAAWATWSPATASSTPCGFTSPARRSPDAGRHAAVRFSPRRRGYPFRGDRAFGRARRSACRRCAER